MKRGSPQKVKLLAALTGQPVKSGASRSMNVTSAFLTKSAVGRNGQRKSWRWVAEKLTPREGITSPVTRSVRTRLGAVGTPVVGLKETLRLRNGHLFGR